MSSEIGLTYLHRTRLRPQLFGGKPPTNHALNVSLIRRIGVGGVR